MKRSNIINFPQKPVFDAEYYAKTALLKLIEIMKLDYLEPEEQIAVVEEMIDVFINSLEDRYEQY